MTPTEAEYARRAGYGNWVDRVGDLTRRIAELEVEVKRLRAFEQLVHSRLDAMGVPKCDEEAIKCGYCQSTEPCHNGLTLAGLPCQHPDYGKRSVECRIAARLDWVAERLDTQTVEFVKAAEREACAKLCDDADKSTHPAELADRIRARSQEGAKP